MRKFIYSVLALCIISCQVHREPIKTEDHSFLKDSLNIDQQLKEHDLAGLSLVIFQNYQIIYSDQWGVKSAHSGEEIDKNTAFSTASISKPVTALLCHILEEKGFINLDDSIAKYLERWQLPDSPLKAQNKPRAYLIEISGNLENHIAKLGISLDSEE